MRDRHRKGYLRPRSKWIQEYIRERNAETAHGKTLEKRAIQPTLHFTPNGSGEVTYPNGTTYLWRNGSRRRVWRS